MKKIIISTFLISSTTLSFSFASEEGFIKNVRSFFTPEKKMVEIKQEIRQEIRSLRQELSSTNTEKAVLDDVLDTENEIKNATNTNNSTNTEEVKDILKEGVFCENKTKLLIKKERLSKQIKNQIREKNRLSDGLMAISANFATETKEKIEDKIIKLEEEVNSTIKIEKSIINLIASSTESACDTKSRKSVSNNLSVSSKIKSLELENEKQLEKVNKFIKKEIKSLLTEIKESQVSL